MHLPASVGGALPPADPLEALQFYSSLGLRCFPATYLDKTPHPRVGKGWERLADLPPVIPERWPDLVADWGRFNVALIGSEHHVILDLDNLDFVSWFDAQGPERLGTWIVRSPRGGLHVHALSDDPQRTTVIKATNGVKIGDVKARGGYVIAPPSVGSNGDYQTEYGSPDAIARQANVLTWFSGFVQAWERTQPVRLQPAVNDQAEYARSDVHSPPPDSRQKELLERLRAEWMNGSLNRKIYDTLKDGVDAVENYWKNDSDRSVVDFGCVKELINVGWTFQEIEELWTFAPVGERYRDTSARNHGHGYLLRTYDAAKRKWDAEQVDLMQSVGPGWKVRMPIERWQEDRVDYYSFSLENDSSHEIHEINRMDARAFASPHKFRDAMYQCSAFFDLGPFNSTKGLQVLASQVRRLSVERPKPELATEDGQIGNQMRLIARERGKPFVVTEQDDIGGWMAWCDGQHVYINPTLVYQYVRRPVPATTAAKLWQQWVSLGGDIARWQGQDCWKAPCESFPDLQPPPSS